MGALIGVQHFARPERSHCRSGSVFHSLEGVLDCVGVPFSGLCVKGVVVLFEAGVLGARGLDDSQFFVVDVEPPLGIRRIDECFEIHLGSIVMTPLHSLSPWASSMSRLIARAPGRGPHRDAGTIRRRGAAFPRRVSGSAARDAIGWRSPYG